MLVRIKAWPAVIALLSLFLGLASPAAATSVAGGTGTLKLDRDVKHHLSEAGVDLSGIGAAKARGRVVTMPIDGGQMEGPPAKGVAIPLGGIELSSGKKVVRLRKIGIDISHGELGAEVAGERRVVAIFSGATVVRDGFGVELTMRHLRLTRGMAATLNRKLGEPRLFGPGRRLAALYLNLELETLKAHSGAISLTFDAAIREKLEAQEVEASLYQLAPAASSIAPGFDFPISYGAISPGLAQGTVGSTTGLRLTVGGGPVFFRDLFLVPIEIDLEAKAVNAWVSIVSSKKSMEKTAIATVDFTGSTLTSDRRAGTISASAVTAALTSDAAALLNEAFASNPHDSLFNAGEPLGTIGFTLSGSPA